MLNLTESEEKYLINRQKWHKEKSKSFVRSVISAGFVFSFSALVWSFLKKNNTDFVYSEITQICLWIAIVWSSVQKVGREKKILEILKKVNPEVGSEKTGDGF